MVRRRREGKMYTTRKKIQKEKGRACLRVRWPQAPAGWEPDLAISAHGGGLLAVAAGQYTDTNINFTTSSCSVCTSTRSAFYYILENDIPNERNTIVFKLHVSCKKKSPRITEWLSEGSELSMTSPAHSGDK